MNIDEMEAGRELDALVAEKVMGFYWREVNEHQKALCPPGIDDFFEVLWGDDLNKYVPQYSRAVYPALEILRKAAVWQIDNMEPGRMILVKIQFPGTKLTTGWAEKIPLAICRAALKAVQVEP